MLEKSENELVKSLLEIGIAKLLKQPSKKALAATEKFHNGRASTVNGISTKTQITSVSKKFILDHMDHLIETLNLTTCSFIRCIKPNPLMNRNIPKWFDRRYVCNQIKSLNYE